MGHDDPAITAPEKIRYDSCLTVPDSFAGTPELPIAVIGDGEYANDPKTTPAEEPLTEICVPREP